MVTSIYPKNGDIIIELLNSYKNAISVFTTDYSDEIEYDEKVLS